MITKYCGNENKRDFDSIARIHIDSMEGGFLTQFGISFLSRLYRGISASQHGFVIVWQQQGRILGFIACSYDTKKMYNDILWSQGIGLLFSIMPLLTSCSIIRKAIETTLYPSRKAKMRLPRSEILSFAVDAQFRGRGIGTILFHGMADEFRKRRIGIIKIISGEGQKAAHRFYVRQKALLYSQVQVHRKKKSLVYLYLIEPVGRGIEVDELPI